MFLLFHLNLFCFVLKLKKKRFQNRRAKEKRLKKDSGRRWPNVLRNGAVERKTNRIKSRKSQNSFQEEDTSNEGDAAVSYDGSLFFLDKEKFSFIFLSELSEHDSDDSLSHIQNNPTGGFTDVITRSTHPSSTDLIAFDSSYGETNNFRSSSSSYPTTSSSLLPTNSYSSSSSSMTINDDQSSSSELDFCTLVSSTNNGQNLAYGHHHWLSANQS